MQDTVTVPLINPIQGHGKSVTSVVIRAPCHKEFAAIGDPYVAITLPDGKPHVIAEPKAIADYLSACVVEPDALLLESLSLADSMNVRKALLGFFEAAAVAIGRSTPISPPRTS